MKYYTYELIDPRNNKVFYVGKGYKNRMYSHFNTVKSGQILRNTKLNNKLKKLIKENLKPLYRKIETDIEQVAFDKEIELIEFYGKENLCNLTDGGRGGMPPFTKEEERQWHIKGAIATNKIRTKYFQKKYKEDKKFKAKMVKSWSNAQKKRYKTQDNPMKDRKHSEESRKKMSISQSGEKNSQFGTIWITNGVENRKTKNKIPKGWAQGRTWNKIG